MNETNLFYWLQGYFEILGAADFAAPGLTIQQVVVIKAHCDLVPVEGESANMKLLRAYAAFAADGLADMKVMSGRIKQVVREQFLHVIDPQAGPPEVQDKLNKLHGIGSIDPKTGAVFRC